MFLAGIYACQRPPSSGLRFATRSAPGASAADDPPLLHLVCFECYSRFLRTPPPTLNPTLLHNCPCCRAPATHLGGATLRVLHALCQSPQAQATLSRLSRLPLLPGTPAPVEFVSLPGQSRLTFLPEYIGYSIVVVGGLLHVVTPRPHPNLLALGLWCLGFPLISLPRILRHFRSSPPCPEGPNT